MHGLRLMGSWVLALFLAVMFVWIADLMLFPPTEAKNIIFPRLVEYSGVQLWEPTGRFMVAILHIVAAFFLVIPWTRRFGALLGLLVSGGAVVAHILWLGTEVPAEVGSSETDGGYLLYLAISLLVASILTLIVHPAKK